ncbi:MAG: DUF4886 domain-containing protein [Planctomycetota bacterium]
MYQIGNSLTWDSQPLGIDAIAGGHDFGHHIRCASSLRTIGNEPITTCVDSPAPYGKYTEALPNYEWDAIALQLYRDGQFISEDIAAATSMINLALSNEANADTHFYLYQSWARRSLTDTWLDESDLSANSRMVNTREATEVVIDAVRSNTGAEVYVIPTGDVFYELSRAIDNGEIEGLTSYYQLYRDDQHASYDLGRYAAGLTAYASIYGTEGIESIVPPTGFYRAENDIWTPDVIEGINGVVASVIDRHEFTQPIPEPSALVVLLASFLTLRSRHYSNPSTASRTAP